MAKASIVELEEADVANNIHLRFKVAPPTYVNSGRVIDKESGQVTAQAFRVTR